MRTRTLAAVAAAPLVLGGVAGPAVAVVDDVTPSTNEVNADNGWAHFTAVPDFGAVELTFVTTRGFDSCFEVRADGEDPLEGQENPNTGITDGLWEYYCVNATDAEGGTKTVPVEADGSVEVRLVFGAERDERFDWTEVETKAVVAPETAQECKKGGFAELGYTNQGRCVSAVKRAQRDARKAARAERRAESKAARVSAKKAGKGKG